MAKGGKRHVTGFKVALWFVVLFLAWSFLQSDMAMNAVLAFLFGGVVPGTDIVLAPSTIMEGVAGILGLGTAVILIRFVIIHWPRRHKTNPAADISQPVTAAAEVTPQPAVSEPVDSPKQKQPKKKQSKAPEQLKTNSRKHTHTPAKAVGPIVKLLDAIGRAVLKALSSTPALLAIALKARGAVVQFIARLHPKIITGLDRTRTANIQVLTGIKNSTHIAGKVTARVLKRTAKKLLETYIRLSYLFVHGCIKIWHLLVAAWYWFAPYLWRYDKWVESKARSLLAWSSASSRTFIRKHDNVSFLVHTTRESARLLSTIKSETVKAQARQLLSKVLNK